MARRKKTPHRKLKDKCEKLAKAIAKRRDCNVCQKSGEYVEGSNCHASHVIPVSADGRLALDTQNMIVLSYHWHINWWHKHPTASGEWFKDTFPRLLKLLKKKHDENRTKGPIKISELEEIYEDLKKQWKDV